MQYVFLKGGTDSSTRPLASELRSRPISPCRTHRSGCIPVEADIIGDDLDGFGAGLIGDVEFHDRGPFDGRF